LVFEPEGGNIKTVIAKHPRLIRWNHWINFPLLTLMIWSGLMIYWANDAYSIRWKGKVLFHFFPDGFFSALGLPFHLADGMAIHFFLMWLFAINGLIYVTYIVASGEWRELLPRRESFIQALQVTLHDLGIGPLPPQGKFNAAQRFAYSGVVLMGAGSLITGLAIYKPVQLGWLRWCLGGYEAARLEHFILTLLYVGFFIVHVAQVLRAGWNNFRAMVSGYEISEK
jgi:thiosulfate reductase cytochrome b subunit